MRRAVELTGGRAEFRDREAPTWDGRCWHLWRIRSEMHVLHEVAHWLALPDCRHMPNYGLGKDPDGGPVTPPTALDRLLTEGRTVLKTLDRDALVAIALAQLSWEEEVASVLSIRLLYLAGFSGWLGEAKRVHLHDARNEWKLWSIAELLKERGVDFENPIPAWGLA